jgi:hypothetical protein
VQFWMYRDVVRDEDLTAEDVPRTVDGEGRGRGPNER